ncbi:MAG: hypothetical protein U9M97_02080 [Candidatus Hadarchaeota archaeon]|nr:hypothetical protein [Candidatus Hadarchaeota archaeon]
MKCPKCGKGVLRKAKENIVVEGVKLAEGLKVEKCDRCGEIVLTVEQASKLRAAAEEAGIWGHGIRLKRKISRIGKKSALYIPVDIERTLGLRHGREVEIRIVGKKMIVEAEK